MRRLLVILTATLLLCACRGRQGQRTDAGATDTLALRHATHLKVIHHDGFDEVRLADPWNVGKVLHTYLLVPAGESLPSGLPHGTVVRTPLRRDVVSTSVHCSLVIDMGRKTSIAGVCEPQYIHIPYINERLRSGEVADCGSGMAPNVETIIDLQPDAIFLSPFQNSGGYGKVEALGIPIIETADYMETSALGRAEWMRFYGLLFGSSHEADSIFDSVEKAYLTLRQQAHQATTAKSIVMDKQSGAVWYVPGGKSTIGGIIADANIGYPWQSDSHSGSLPLPFESVLEKGGQADLWLFRYNSPQPITSAALLSENSGYKQFKAFQEKNIYGCNTATSTFYEETPFHPHLLLRDFICIAHPELGLGQPKYFLPVNE